jgi:protein-tyrosine phosphatase
MRPGNLVDEMIDLHNHLLPGLDDGPADVAGSLEMARAAVAAGVTIMACTPHVAAKYPNRASEIRLAVERLRLELDAAAIALQIVPGAEISTTVIDRLDDVELRQLSLGGSGWLLVEAPFAGWPVRLPKLIAELEIRGFRVLMAHPERAEAIQHNPDRLRDLVGRGALVQCNGSSFVGDHGRRVTKTAQLLLRNGLVHILASDAHSSSWRPPGVGAGQHAAARALGVWPEDLDWMVEAGPRQILDGGIVRPPRFVAPPGGAGPRPAQQAERERRRAGPRA